MLTTDDDVITLCCFVYSGKSQWPSGHSYSEASASNAKSQPELLEDYVQMMPADVARINTVDSISHSPKRKSEMITVTNKAYIHV